jgi:hypothetical protein
MTALAFLVLALGLLVMVGLLSWRVLQLPSSDPNRLVAELRLAQTAAPVLALVAGGMLGLAASQEARPGMTLEVLLAAVFFAVAAIAPFRDPRDGLTLLAAAFAAHAIADVLHRPGLLADGLAPRWYAIGCAVHNLVAGALCYLPVLRR